MFIPEATPENIALVTNVIDLVCQFLVGMMILATILVRLVAKKRSDDVTKISSRLLNVMHFFPTFGKNPRTKALEEALQAILKETPEAVKIITGEPKPLNNKES